MGNTEISISLTEQEELFIELKKLAEHSQEVTALLQEASDLMGTLCEEGEFKNRIVKNDQATLSRFILKAQTLQTLAEVLTIHTENTYKSTIDLDKMLALDIANQLMVDSNTPSETKQALQANTEDSVYAIKEMIAEERGIA